MYTSDIKARARRAFYTYLAVYFLCSAFGVIYETFSHGVISVFMLFCGVPPLLFGVLPFFIIFMTGRGFPGRLAYNLYNSGVATLTVGFIFTGVLQIYGTTNPLCNVYFVAAAAFLIAGAICWVCGAKKDKNLLEKNKTV